MSKYVKIFEVRGDTMTFTKEMVDDYADKLLIGLTDQENEMVRNELANIDADFDEFINKFDGLNEVEAMYWCLDRDDYSLREDTVEESIPLEELLKNCKVKSGDLVEVPKVVD